jgi:hypothetical protein
MAQVVSRCRATGHYLFMGIDVDPKEFAKSSGPFSRKYCPYCACEHLWHREDSKFRTAEPATKPRIQQAS